LPIYAYQTDDGHVVEMIFKMSERPKSIVLTAEDCDRWGLDHELVGTVACHIISPVARRVRGWSTFGDGGVSGEWSPTFGTHIENDAHRTRLEREHGLERITTRDQLARAVEGDGAAKEHRRGVIERRANRKRERQLIEAGVSRHEAHETVYGAQEAAIAKRAEAKGSDIVRNCPIAATADIKGALRGLSGGKE
jgi:hypothetical protein